MSPSKNTPSPGDRQLTPPDTDRLQFRNWKQADLDPFHTICSDPQVMRFVGNGQIWSRERTGHFIQFALDTLQQYGYCQWALIHKTDQIVIGYCGFVKTESGPEIGWRLTKGYWGQGLATEAAKAALKHGLETLGFQRVLATVQAENSASIRVIEKLGMRLEASFDRSGREILRYSTDSVLPAREY